MLKHAVDAIFTYVSVNKIASCFSCAFLTFSFRNDVFGFCLYFINTLGWYFLAQPNNIIVISYVNHWYILYFHMYSLCKHETDCETFYYYESRCSFLCYLAMLLMISVYIDDFSLLMISIMIMLMMIMTCMMYW